MPPGIEAESLYAGYGGEAILRGLTAKIEGDTLILGPNGSGKTTLVKAVLGLASIYSGTLSVDGIDVQEAYGSPGLVSSNLEEVYRLLYLDSLRLADLYMDLVGGSLDEALALMESLGLERGLLSRRSPWELSAGQRRIYTTALALASRAKYVLLDEPMEGLDPSRRVKMLDIIRSSSSVKVVVTHETWVLKALRGWSVYLIFEGRAYGPVEASSLAKASIVAGRAPDSLVTIETERGVFSIVPSGGKPVTDLLSLDRVYEILAGL